MSAIKAHFTRRGRLLKQVFVSLKDAHWLKGGIGISTCISDYSHMQRRRLFHSNGAPLWRMPGVIIMPLKCDVCELFLNPCVWQLKHPISVGSFLGYLLGNVPVLHDLTVLDLENVDNSAAPRTRLPKRVHMQDYIVSVSQHPLDLAMRTRILCYEGTG